MEDFLHNEKSTNLLKLEQFNLLFLGIINADEYIPHCKLEALKKDWNDFFEELLTFKKNDMLPLFCEKHGIKNEFMETQLERFNNFHDIIEKKNQYFIEDHLVKDKEYLDTILKSSDPSILLDNNQREVVLTDEDHILVVAGAGSGKTTTIEAKVKYLVDKKNIDPHNILIVSYTREATKELENRINTKLKIDAEISTFHAIGNKLIQSENNKRHDIVDFGFLVSTLQEYFNQKMGDESFIKKTLLFFASYLETPFDETNIKLLFKKLNSDDNTTLKQDLKEQFKELTFDREKSKRTLLDERVLSVQEAKIANFLYINGIDYEYQPLYPYGIKGTIKPYLPDFLLKQGDNEVYLEHFALSESGINNRFSQKDQELYKQHINDKVILHREHNTKLIYTFSQYNDERDLIIHLQELLEKNGFIFNRINDKEIYKKLLESVKDRYFLKFIYLVGNFINKIKVNAWNQSKILELKILVKDERTKLFLDIAYECFLIYEQKLKERNAIDFEDMINNASTILDSYIKNGKKLHYQYIFIDEYQDISLQRFNLAHKLSLASNAKIIAVGDDWQSIFKFAGGNITLFTEFEKFAGTSKLITLLNTYRNSQELIDIAGGFVQVNPMQIKKELKSPKSIKNPVILMSYNDSYEKEAKKTPFVNMCEAIEQAIDDIVKRDGDKKEILLIGRFNFDGKILEGSHLFSYYNGKVVCKKHPQTPIIFSTAHSSKGLGFNNVIIINGKDHYMGFPSKIEDDPIMKLVLKNNEEIEYSEERRLFYVALTRTKNRVFIIVPQHAPSKFVLELKDKFTNVVLNGGELDPKEEFQHKTCPYCGYPLQKRKNKILGVEIYLCSNEPEVCGFMTNNIKGGKLAICKCPECLDGYLVVKQIKGKENWFLLGCNNYKNDGTGCNYIILANEFSFDRDKLKFNKEIFKEHFIYKDLEIYEILNIIFNCINKLNKEFPNMCFDAIGVSQILKGDHNKMIESFKLENFDYFNRFSSIPKNKIVNIIKYLIDLNIFIEEIKGKYKTLLLGNKTIIDLNNDDVKNIIKLLI
ncbi:MAG: UvrD-helicase domain-containing protein [Bacilli bacterium]